MLGRLVGPGAAVFWRDACREFLDPRLESAAHQVAHCLREVESAVRHISRPLHDGPRHEQCPECGQSKDGHKADIQAILEELGIDPDDPEAASWLSLAKKRELPRRAHRQALAGPWTIGDDFEQFFERVERIFDRVLTLIETHFVRYFGIIDEILAEDPTKEAVKRLRNEVPHTEVTHRHLFESLPNITWLVALGEAGFFDFPPPPERDDEVGSIRFPPWPASSALLRLAESGADAKTLLEYVDKIPETENSSVHEDLCGVLLQVPAALAAHRVDLVIDGLAHPYALHLSDAAGQLMVHLADGGEVEAAGRLARVLLRPEKAPRVEPEGQDIGGGVPDGSVP